jgi:uncharacterized protein with von Willebrand factor type A (vWA) domain
MRNFTQILEEAKKGKPIRRVGARWFVQMVDKRLCTYRLDGGNNRVFDGITLLSSADILSNDWEVVE